MATLLISAALLFAGVAESARVQRLLAARSIAAAGLPDPKCKTGVISSLSNTTVCCAGYCGECTDYETCKSVRGQDSENACCASSVSAWSCEGGAPANICIKLCTESVPPCIMPETEEFVFPETKRTAGDDCNAAVPDFMKQAQAAVEAAGQKTGGPTGEEQWQLMRERNFVPSSVVYDKMKKLVGHLPEGFSFKVLDGNGDGGLSSDEMQKYFSAALPGGYDATVVNSIHKAFDSNKDGLVDKIEMSAGMAGLGGPAPAAFLQAMICLSLTRAA